MNILSPFLCLFKTNKNECLAYSGMTNSFMKLNDNLFNLLKKASLNVKLLGDLDQETFKTLKYAKVICTQEEIDNAINQKKFLRELDTFGNEYLNLTIAPTSSCNFACPYCFEKGIKHETMDDKTIEALLNFIEKKSENTNKTVSIMWYGGEPLLAIKKIDRIMAELNKRNINIMYNGMVTNGYYLNKTNQKKLKEYNIKFIQITLDGASSKAHNKRRFNRDGTGSWDTILNNIDILLSDKDFDIDNLSIRCNIDHYNKKEYKLLKKNLLKRWNNDKRVFIHSAILQEYNKDDNIECNYLSDEEAAEYLIKQKKKEKNIPFFYYNIGGCSATRLNSYLIGARGELYKCWNDLGRNKRIVGSIFNDTVENKNLLFNFLCRPTMFDDKECLSCPLFFVCDGGCQSSRIDIYRNKGKKNLCHFAKKYLEEYLSAYYEIKINQNK